MVLHLPGEGLYIPTYVSLDTLIPTRQLPRQYVSMSLPASLPAAKCNVRKIVRIDVRQEHQKVSDIYLPDRMSEDI